MILVSATRKLVCIAAALLLGQAAMAARQIVVAQDGSGQFTSVSQAVDSVTNATVKEPVDILIKPGTYTEMLTTRDWVNLIGADRDQCILKYDVGNNDLEAVVKMHVLWATSNTLIKNLTLIGYRVKYCIHSDGGGDYLLVLENCVLKRDRSLFPVDYNWKNYPAAFGIGLRGKRHIWVKNCLIQAECRFISTT